MENNISEGMNSIGRVEIIHFSSQEMQTPVINDLQEEHNIFSNDNRTTPIATTESTTPHPSYITREKNERIKTNDKISSNNISNVDDPTRTSNHSEIIRPSFKAVGSSSNHRRALNYAKDSRSISKPQSQSDVPRENQKQDSRSSQQSKSPNKSESIAIQSKVNVDSGGKAIPGVILRKSQRETYQSLRISRYKHAINFIESQLVNQPKFIVLIIPISSYGHLTIFRSSNLPKNDDENSEDMLCCSDCDVLIPLSHIACHFCKSLFTYTAELLAEFGTLHAIGCIGKTGTDKLREEEVHEAIAEGASFLLYRKVAPQLDGELLEVRTFFAITSC